MRTKRLSRLSAAACFALGAMLAAGCGSGGEEPASTQPPVEASTAPEPTSQEPSSEQPTSDDPEDGASQDWQEVDVGDGTFLVPPTWEVESYSSGGTERERALYSRGYCATNDKLVTGVAFTAWVPDETDVAAALEAEAERMAGAFEDRSPQVELSEFEENGEWLAVVAAVTLDQSSDPCAPVEAVFVLKGAPYPDGSGTFVFTVVGELGLEASPAPEDLVEISNSLQI